MKERLIELAKEEAKRIIEEAKKEANKIIEEAKKEREIRIKEIKNRIKKEVEREIKIILSQEIIKIREDIVNLKYQKKEEIKSIVLRKIKNKEFDFQTFFNNFLEYSKKFGEVKDIINKWDEENKIIIILDNGINVVVDLETIEEVLDAKIKI